MSPASARSASTSWVRTRSRSSWLAARPNVTISIWSRVATSSATKRATSAPIVQVLPVPALASSTVVPVGSGARMSNGSITASPPARRR